MDRETFLHILKIARLKLTDDEMEEFLPQFQEIFDLMNRVKEISFPDSYEEEISNPFRGDEENTFNEDLTSIFPRKKDRYLEVPKNL